MLFIYLLYQALHPVLRRIVLVLTLRKHHPAYGRKKAVESTARYCRFPRKPDWVAKELIRMKALMTHAGCRALAASFNRRFAGKESVGKTYVYNVQIKRRHEIALLRRNLKKRTPRPVPHNLIWGLDLIGKQDTDSTTHNIFGIVEHVSRASLVLLGLKDKASLTLLRYLLDAIEQYGKPKLVRTDNESIFTSRLFRFGLWWLGIKHQKTDKGCPWMNGRIERFFGTLKQSSICGKSITSSSLTARWVNSGVGITMYGHIRTSPAGRQPSSGKAWIFSLPGRAGSITTVPGMDC